MTPCPRGMSPLFFFTALETHARGVEDVVFVVAGIDDPNYSAYQVRFSLIRESTVRPIVRPLRGKIYINHGAISSS
jgi:hypothetical protein